MQVSLPASILFMPPLPLKIPLTLQTSLYYNSSNTSDPEEVKKLVPTKYHAYLNVFSPIKVQKLPQHHSYDVNIDLEEGKTPPFGPIYFLSVEEHQAVFDYVEEHLAKGFIHPSTSSAASPILFIKCKTSDLCLCVDYRGLNHQEELLPPSSHS